ncbi:MAG: hypothetical protein IKA64_07485 [Clostridia bacterium]|nr:hypothetical protein [Clostridia bacterium]
MEEKDARQINKFERRSPEAKIAADIARALLFYLSFILISSTLFVIYTSMYETITESFDRVPRFMYIVSSLSLPFSLFSVVRSFELYDKEAQLSRHPFPEGYSLGEDIKATYGTPTLRRKLVSKLAVCWLLILILPFNAGYTALVGSFVPDFALPRVYLNLIAKAIMLPLSFLFVHLGVFSAHKWWAEGAEGAVEKILGTRHCNLRLILELLKIALIYGVSFYALPSVVMLLVSFLLTLALFRGSGIWIFLASLIVAVVLAHYIRALLRRRSFLRRLRALASDEGWELVWLKGKMSSVFRAGRGATLTLRRGERLYSCKLIAAVNPRNPTYIDYEGGITAKITVSFFRFFELFHYLIRTDYTFDGEGVKVVILSPEPRKILINSGRTDIAPDSFDSRAKRASRARHSQSFLLKRSVTHRFETGDRIGEYRFFTEAGFLSALDNDCIER